MICFIVYKYWIYDAWHIADISVGMNLRVGGSSPSQVEIFFVSKTLILLQERLFVCRKSMMFPEHS